MSEKSEETKQAKESALSKELLNAIESKNLIIGYNSAIHALKTGKAAKIIYANNAPEKVKSEIIHYSGLSKTPAQMFDSSNTGLGVKCKRAHSVLVVAIKKENK